MGAVKKVDSQKDQKFIRGDICSLALVESAVYDEEILKHIRREIVRRIRKEMDKNNISVTNLHHMTNITYSHLHNVFTNNAELGISAIIRIGAALKVNPREFFPFEEAHKSKSYGERIDKLMGDLDLVAKNYVYNMCVDYIKEYKRINRKK